MILVIDNYDSFTYNLVQYLGELGVDPVVRRNDEITLDEIAAFNPRAIVLSPGPKTPADAGVTIPVIKRFGSEIPLLGVCLGHQAIGEAYGGKVVRAANLMHGKTSYITHSGIGIFNGLPNPLRVMRYHSLIVDRATFPDELEVIASGIESPDEIHALKHREYPVWGVQFHPESILTQDGKKLLENFLELSQ